MLTYLMRRLTMTAIVLFAIMVATFLIIHLVPGDPVRVMLGGRASPEQVAAGRAQLGLDQPLFSQFTSFLGNTLTGHLGTSITMNEDVGKVVLQRLTPSLLMISYGLFFALIMGVPLAIITALRPNGVLDGTIRFVATFSFAMPAFWLGLMLALLFGLGLKWFPVSGYDSGVGGAFRTLTLPALTIGLGLTVVVVRTLRSSLLEVLQTDYIDAARSRGLSEMRVVGRHALRNAMMSTITILSVDIGFLIGGTVVVEAVFQIPGVGLLLLQAVQHRDYQLVQALALLAGTAVVLVGLAADLLQAFIDPRVRLAK